MRVDDHSVRVGIQGMLQRLCVEFAHHVFHWEQVKVTRTTHCFAYLLLDITGKSCLIPGLKFSGRGDKVTKKFQVVPLYFVRVDLELLLATFLRPSGLRMWEHKIIEYISTDRLSPTMLVRLPEVISWLEPVLYRHIIPQLVSFVIQGLGPVNVDILSEGFI